MRPDGSAEPLTFVRLEAALAEARRPWLAKVLDGLRRTLRGAGELTEANMKRLTGEAAPLTRKGPPHR